MRTSLWREGKHLDMWSLNHLLSGVIFAGWMLVWGFQIGVIFLIYLVLAVGWEFLEPAFGVSEHRSNRVSDVVVGLLGLPLVFVIRDGSGQVSLVWLVGFTLVYIALGAWGYLAHRALRRDRY